MKKINVNVSWSRKNYVAVIEEEEIGTVVVTNKTLEGLKSETAEALSFHIDEMKKDGEAVAGWLSEGMFEFEWTLHISALLKESERYTSLAAISRASGINERQLGHYANGIKVPREEQRRRIVEGIQSIGRECLAICG